MSAQYELIPLNKYVWIEEVKSDGKVGEGLLYAPGNALEKQYRIGIIKAIHECEESKGLKVGETVLYDAVGAVNHRVGNQTITTVRVLNVLGIIRQRTDLPRGASPVGY